MRIEVRQVERAATIYRRAVITLAALALAECALALAPLARADSTDANYLKLLAHFGITCENVGSPSCTDAELIQMGHAICSDLENGREINSETNGLVDHSSGALSRNLAMYLVTAAIFSYCPDEKKLMQDQ
jgi:Protein of unknown function (DUF732)